MQTVMEEKLTFVYKLNVNGVKFFEEALSGVLLTSSDTSPRFRQDPAGLERPKNQKNLAL